MNATEIKHTLTPWRVENLRDELRVYGAPGSGDPIATVHTSSIPGPAPRDLADAYLIAAAPELLEALKTLYHIYIELDDAFAESSDISKAAPELLAARAAIAKAEGRVHA